MDWKFWNKSAAPSRSATEAASDTFEAVRELLGMLMRADAPPFSNWDVAGIVFTPEIENTAQSATKGYALALWFWLFAEKHGIVAARMARDTFCLLADEAQPSTGDVLDNLIELENRLIQSFDATPAEQRSFVLGGRPLELPMEFVLATGFLLQSPDSPYNGRTGDDLEGNDIRVAACLRNATEHAMPLFRERVRGLPEFDAHALPLWKWSATLGGIERHLMRRYNNPLFPLHRQVVTSKDVYDARVADHQTLAELRRELTELTGEFYAHTELPADWQPFLNGFRERFDSIEDRRLLTGGESAVLGAAIAEMRDNVMTLWRTALQNSKHTLSSVETADKLEQKRRATLHATDWLRQLRSHSSPIPPQEVAAALLSDSPAEIETAVLALRSEPELRGTLENCRSHAHRLVAEVRAGGHPLPGIDEKLRLLEDSAP